MSGSPEPLWGSSTVETASIPFSGCTAGRFNQYSTLQEHMPPEHQKYVQWNGERFIHWIGKVSSNTQAAVQAILGSYKVEQQGYKSCVDLLRLTNKYTLERLENACKRALEYTPRPSLKKISQLFWHPARIKESMRKRKGLQDIWLRPYLILIDQWFIVSTEGG